MKWIIPFLLISFSSFAEPYKRSLYPHWIDQDSDCQDTRAETLIDSSLAEVAFNVEGCRVLLGVWYGSYSNQYFYSASQLDIDHIVPLKEAHASGAVNWTREQRKAFANDPINLIPVKASQNRAKGSRDPAKWLPANKNHHCEYVSKWLFVKNKYSLEIDTDEQKTINRIVAGNCN